MRFYLPMRLYREDNCVINHRAELAALGSRALIVTGRSSAKKNGALADVTEALESEKRQYAVFSEIEENPSVETVMRARDFGLSEGCDFVIGIGGGSPLDASKAIALMMKNASEGADFLYDKTKPTSCLPCAAVPTTCGTGSEATPYSILTRHALRTKGSLPHMIFPSLALIDAKYLKFAPKGVILSTAIDALGHLFESFVNSNRSDYSAALSLGGMDVWSRSLDVFKGKRGAENADYANMMNASALGGMAIALTGTSIPHGLSYTLTYELGVTHGLAVGYFESGYLKAAPAAERDLVLLRSGFSSTDDFEEFFASVWGERRIDEATLKDGADRLLSNTAKLKNCPYEVNREILYKISGI